MLKHFPKFLVKFLSASRDKLVLLRAFKMFVYTVLCQQILEPTHIIRSFDGLQAQNQNKEFQMLQHFPKFLVKFESVLYTKVLLMIVLLRAFKICIIYEN